MKINPATGGGARKPAKSMLDNKKVAKAIAKSARDSAYADSGKGSGMGRKFDKYIAKSARASARADQSAAARSNRAAQSRALGAKRGK